MEPVSNAAREFIPRIRIADDKRMTQDLFEFDEIGVWSELKLEIVEKYGSAYTKAFNKSGNLKKYYIDAFSGPGAHV